MGDLKARLRMGTQEPLFELRQEAADRIAELEAENYTFYMERMAAHGLTELAKVRAERAEAALREVSQLEDELRNTYSALPDLTRANPDRVDRFVRNLIADELRGILVKHHGHVTGPE